MISFLIYLLVGAMDKETFFNVKEWRFLSPPLKHYVVINKSLHITKN